MIIDPTTNSIADMIGNNTTITKRIAKCVKLMCFIYLFLIRFITNQQGIFPTFRG